MAKVFFYGATLPIGTLRDWYDAGYKTVIFQLESEDSNNWRDRYALVAYPINSETGYVGGMLKLEKTDQYAKVHDRVLIGNIPFYQSQIEKYLNASGVEYLLFTAKLPKETMPKLKDYVVYKVESMPSELAVDIEDELHPSPPAPPPPEQ